MTCRAAKITVAPLPLSVDPLSLFAPLAQRPWAMLLDSAIDPQAERHMDARYDIIVAEPLATLTTYGQRTRIEHQGNVIESDEDPMLLLQQWQQRLLGTVVGSNELPFCGGAAGHFSYDLGRRFEQLPATASDDIGLAEMAVGIYDWALLLDHNSQQVQLAVVGDAPQWQQRQQWLQQQWQQAQPSSNHNFALQGPWQHQIDRQRYQQQFEQVQAYLLSGDCYQINLTQRFQAPYQGSEWQAYQRLRQGNLAPFSAFIRLPDCALLSVSPERFLKLDGDQIETKPIKGTRPRSNDPSEDKANAQALRQASKDQAENLMIVDLLRNDIGRVAAAGTVRVPKLFEIESFPAVHHLVSTITATLAPQHSATDLLRAAFPGGSITGAPKIRAMEIIEELEPQRRSLYCGSIGYVSVNGKMDTSITIRSLVAKAGQLYCWAGGGIVADSVCDEEHQEIFDKLSRILPRLQ
ncbi:aminodeoxychorismate synthase component I [uncultured Ferrimonas sp.]|uniref:aminodeoxychorismate synthase component I n=1 Tax=uncultured Ferrimonas sp. TaxID=432640 RepID=UPI00261770CC|nr:aminodeoxychorismate synthase component I [uncultured Ferrimonas sp.]